MTLQPKPAVGEQSLARNHPVQMMAFVKGDAIILEAINAVKNLGERLKKIGRALGK